MKQQSLTSTSKDIHLSAEQDAVKHYDCLATLTLCAIISDESNTDSSRWYVNNNTHHY